MGTDYPNLKGKHRRFAREQAEAIYYRGLEMLEDLRKRRTAKKRKKRKS